MSVDYCVGMPLSWIRITPQHDITYNIIIYACMCPQMVILSCVCVVAMLTWSVLNAMPRATVALPARLNIGPSMLPAAE